MMKKIWMTLVAVACYTLTATVFTACTDQTDNPVVPPSPEADSYSFVDDMDESVAPGDDFYQYVIGSWLKDHPVSETGSQGTMAEQDRLGTTWLKSILNESSPDPVVADLFRRVKTASADREGNIALLHAKTAAIAALDGREEVVKAMGQLMAQGYKPVLYVDFAGDAENMQVVFCAEPFTDDDDLGSVLEMMEYTPEEAAQMLGQAGLFFNGSNNEDVDYRYWFNPDNVRKAIPFNKSKVRSMNTRGGGASFGELIVESLGIDPDYALLTDEEVEQNLAIFEYFSSTDEGLEQLKAMMQLAVIKRDAPYISVASKDDLVNLFLSDFKTLNYQLSKLYAEQNITANDREYVANMCEEFRITLGNRIKRLDWMSEVTKQRAIQKLNEVYFFSGYPDEWDSRFYLSVPTGDGTLYETVVQIMEQQRDLELSLLPGPCTPDKILVYFTQEIASWEANAFYAPNFNYVNILASNLIAPICDTALGDAYNYAVIGATTIGHELTHGFDSSGANFDEKGRLSDWWSPEDKATFVQKQQLLIDHFNAYEALPGIFLNGENTITENIADLGGLETALEILTDRCNRLGYSQEALEEQTRVFLLSFAQGWKSNSSDRMISWLIENDVHSPEKWRVNAQVNNLDCWYRLFNVVEGEKLYVDPSKRVHIW